jgi:cell wall-associated NlpC family hydrolase
VVPKGKKVDVFVNRDGWYRIEYKDMSGWVQADCITVEGESDCLGYCRVLQNSVNLREEASLESGKLEKMPKGMVLQVTGKSEDGEWYVVTYNGHSGYVSREYVEDVDGCTEGYVQTMANSLSLRTGAGSNFARLITIPQGKVLPVSGTVGDWYEVKYGKFTGYVSGAFVSATTEDGFRAYPDYLEIMADDVPVREEPNEEAAELENLEKGTLLAIQGIRDGWYQVTYNGETGYVNAEQAERGTEAADQAAEQAAAAIEAGGEAMTQSNGGGSSILDYASQFIGNPYVWGGTSLTGGADCSGFVKSVLAHFGIDVPHSSASIRGCGRQVSESEMQPGDIVCYSGHVGIYAGDGRLLSALGKKYGITYNSVHYKNILSVRRFT